MEGRLVRTYDHDMMRSLIEALAKIDAVTTGGRAPGKLWDCLLLLRLLMARHCKGDLGDLPARLDEFLDHGAGAAANQLRRTLEEYLQVRECEVELSDLRYSQPSISPYFARGSSLEETIAEMRQNPCILMQKEALVFEGVRFHGEQQQQRQQQQEQ